MGARHAARQLALQALYALEMNPTAAPEAAIQGVWEERGAAQADREFFENAVRGTWRHRSEVDEAIQRCSRRWKLHRMDRIDKSVLRLAAHELMHCPEVPAQVILNEAVELAKEFGSPDSPAFVNGILDRIAQQCRAGELGQRGSAGG
ncbi:MAG: transcription antitermination factor NusB [Deferrisomatales bacterium]